MNHVPSLPTGRPMGRPFDSLPRPGSGARATPRRRSSGPLRGAKYALFLFVALYYFPLSIPGYNLYKFVGWALAALTGVALATGRARLTLSKLFVVPALTLFMAGLVGSMAFGEIDSYGLTKMVQNLVLLMLVPVLVEDSSDVVLVLKGIAFGGVLTAMSGVLNQGDLVAGRVTGILTNANGYGQICGQASIVLIAMLLLARRTLVKVLIGLFLVPTITGLILSGSRGATIAFGSALLAFLVMRGTRGVAILGGRAQPPHGVRDARGGFASVAVGDELESGPGAWRHRNARAPRRTRHRCVAGASDCGHRLRERPRGHVGDRHRRGARDP